MSIIPEGVPVRDWLRHPSNGHIRDMLPAMFPEMFLRERNGRLEVLRWLG